VPSIKHQTFDTTYTPSRTRTISRPLDISTIHAVHTTTQLAITRCLNPLNDSLQWTGGKGTPRRKVVKKSQAASQGDDRKLQAALKKLNVTAVSGVEEVNMFKDDGNVLHFASPRGALFLFFLH